MSTPAIEREQPNAQPFHSGDRIRKAREHIHADRQTFADMIGIHRDTLAKYEEGGKAKKAALNSIALVSGVRVEWLETGELPWMSGPSNPRASGAAGGIRTLYLVDSRTAGNDGEITAVDEELAPILDMFTRKAVNA